MGFKVASRVRGLSDEAFREAFGTKEQCRAALVRLRWPDGFVCPCCGHREHCVLAGRGLYQCNRCKKQTSPTAGTIFHATKLPLTLWFAAIHLVVTAKNGISSVELGRRLGVKQPTAWAVKHKIMAVMARREGETRLTGRGLLTTNLIKRFNAAASGTKVAPIVTFGAKRSPRHPDTPTLAELSGNDKYDFTFALGFYGNTAMPPEVAERIYQVRKEAQADPAIVDAPVHADFPVNVHDAKVLQESFERDLRLLRRLGLH